MLSCVFQFGTFFSVDLSESRCIFTFGPSSSPSNSLSMLLIHLFFLLFSLSSPILLQIYFVSCHQVVGMCLCIIPLYSGKIVSLLWTILFCLYCFLQSRYLFSLPSFASTFWFISSSCIVCFTCVAFTFLCQRTFSILSFLLVVLDFLSAFPVEFPIQVVCFCSCSFEEHRFYNRLISFLHRLVRLVPWS